MIIKLIKNAFYIAANNLMLATPLLISLLIVSFCLGGVNAAPASILMIIIIAVLLIGIVIAGSFHVLKKIFDKRREILSNPDKSFEPVNFIKEFLNGVGEYFLPSIVFMMSYVVLIMLFTQLSAISGKYFLGDVFNNMMKLAESGNFASNANAFFSGLSSTDFKKVLLWNLLYLVFSSVFSLLTFLWLPSLFYYSKNVFAALFKSIKCLFAKPWEIILLFLFLTLFNFLSSVLLLVKMPHYILSFIGMLIYFYYLIYYFVLIFNYYDERFAEKD